MGSLLFILGILLFVLQIVLHELGHAIAARRNGVEVEEFGIGFPPRAWGKKLKNGTLFSLNWLPLGGFVKLKGEHDSAKGPGTYGAASLKVKTKILLAGVAVNWLTAVLVFTVLALFGLPKVLPNQFGVPGDSFVTTHAVRAAGVGKDTPAEKTGIKPGDEIISINGVEVTGARQFAELTEQNAGRTVPFVYKHEKQVKEVVVTLNKDGRSKGYIGIGPGDQATQRATWSAPIVGIGVSLQFTYETLKGLGGTIVNLFTAQFAAAGEGVTGPVGIVNILRGNSDAGVVPVIFLIGIIALTLAVMNVLPIPALDGGRLFVTLLFRVLKKPLTKEREENIQATGFIVLMLLVLLITIVDVRRLL